jgi:hypothetical protein
MENNSVEKKTENSRPVRSKLFRIAGHVIAGVVFAVIFAFVFALFVQFIWNSVMPELFGLKTITFWQGFGIIILAKLLFGGFGRHSHDRWNADRSDSPWDHRKEDKYPPGRHSKDWKEYRQYWKEKGKASFESYMNGLEKEE